MRITLDQFYTSPSFASICMKQFKQFLTDNDIDDSNYTYLEPSAGAGVFLNLMPQDRRQGLDLAPKHDEVIQTDFYKFKPIPTRKYIVLGNPPFGYQGSDALLFIQHAYKFADIVAFVLPVTFRVGTANNLRNHFKDHRLVNTKEYHNIKFLHPNRANIRMNVVFSIYSKKYGTEIEQPKDYSKEVDKVFAIESGRLRTVGLNKQQVADKIAKYQKDKVDGRDLFIISKCFQSTFRHKDFEPVAEKILFDISKSYHIIDIKKGDKQAIISELKKIDWFSHGNRASSGGTWGLSGIDLKRVLYNTIITKGDKYGI